VCVVVCGNVNHNQEPRDHHKKDLVLLTVLLVLCDHRTSLPMFVAIRTLVTFLWDSLLGISNLHFEYKNTCMYEIPAIWLESMCWNVTLEKRRKTSFPQTWREQDCCQQHRTTKTCSWRTLENSKKDLPLGDHPCLSMQILCVSEQRKRRQ